MTPKEKAIDLVNEFTSRIKIDAPIFGLTTNEAKQCAIIAVDEILSISYFDPEHMTEDDSFYKNYWILVKTEIEQL